MATTDMVASSTTAPRLFIRNQPVETETFDSIDPATGKAWLQVPACTKAMAEDAVSSAKDAQEAWAATPLLDRIAMLELAADRIEAIADKLADALVHDQGKPLQMAQGEIKFTSKGINRLSARTIPEETVESDFMIEKLQHRPLGVVCCIAPWNFPAIISALKWSRALFYGNTVIVKPSPETPVVDLMIAEALAGDGTWQPPSNNEKGSVFPSGVFTVLTAPDGGTDFNLGAFLSLHPSIRGVSFTGSTSTGKSILASSSTDVKRVTLEMGGNDAAIIRPDVDVKETAKQIFNESMVNTGQVCIAIKRVYCHESIYYDFVQALVEQAEEAASTVGSGFDEGVKYGPINNARQLERVKELIEDAVAQGATVVAGGGSPPGTTAGTDGFFFAPTILTGVHEGMRIVDEEQFGPVLPVMPYNTDEEAISRANHGEYGLGASVWTKDMEAANMIANRLDAGSVWENCHGNLGSGQLPFGGRKASGLGREHGETADLACYTESVVVRAMK